MNRNKIFIFSTRYSFLHYPDVDAYKDGEHLFSEKNCENKEVFDKSSLFEPTDNEKEEIQTWGKDNARDDDTKNEFIQLLKEKYNEEDDDFYENEWQDITDVKSIEIFINLVQKRYYAEKKEKEHYCRIKGKNIYAVNPYDKNDKAKEWVECLLQNFSKENNDEVFLLLHDRDIYLNGEPFKVLDEAEINNYSSKTINIVVYNHEKNPVTDILRYGDLEKEKKIEDKIESIFYKYLLKKRLLKYVDAKFKGEEPEKTKANVLDFVNYYNNNVTKFSCFSAEEQITIQLYSDIDVLNKESFDRLKILI